ncbi:CidA/LrgA family protein [Cohnella cellulosilytica]|uniref:CidA/LrgA family protein n=1 Tax=Cohnella cellulosilytica TaxID=986710 RepID=A0ABW2F949_9BACL
MTAIVKGIAILIAFYLAGVGLEAWLHLPIPANVTGMILLALCLFAGIVKLEWIEKESGLLLRHMGLFFVPAIVGTIAFADLMKTHWLYVVAGVVPGTLLVMAVSGFVTKGLSRKEKEAHDSADVAG